MESQITSQAVVMLDVIGFDETAQELAVRTNNSSSGFGWCSRLARTVHENVDAGRFPPPKSRILGNAFLVLSLMKSGELGVSILGAADSAASEVLHWFAEQTVRSTNARNN